MPRHVAFLRGINVGGHRVKMDRLRALFEEMGFRDVVTFIASGNVAFSTESDDAGALEERIERHLGAALGYEVATFIRSPARLAAIVASGASRGASGSHYVIFLHGPAPASLRTALTALQSDTDDFEFEGSEVHWRLAGKLSDSPLFAGAFDRATRGIALTSRNMKTLERIVAKVAP